MRDHVELLYRFAFIVPIASFGAIGSIAAGACIERADLADLLPARVFAGRRLRRSL